MGCDGGTIPKRDELVRKKKKVEKVTKEDSRNTKWQHCAMSQAPLQKPIVACETGRFFNKESILNFLLQKKATPESVNAMFAYIRNLRDVKELRLTKNPIYKDEAGKAGQAQKTAEFICPITGYEMSGNYKFVFLWPCGCVFSERGLKEVKDGVCVECSHKYTDDDIISLNPSQEEMEGLEGRMNERRAKNSNKKRKKQPAAGASGESKAAATSSNDDDVSNEPPTKKNKPNSPTPPPSSVAGPSSSSLAGPSSSSGNATSSKPSKQPSTSKLGKEKEKCRKYKSVQDDPNATEAYKSIFNSHPKAKNQEKAHWVTCNPLYY